MKDVWKAITNWFKGKPKKPSKVTDITSEIDMSKNVTVRWVLPTTRQGGGELLPADIEHTRAELSADGGANFSELDLVAPDVAQEVFVPDMEVGEWHFRFTVFDKLGQKSPPANHVETVADDSPPNPVTDITSEQT